jgi:ABC-type Na+ efflux pump permease subunit
MVWERIRVVLAYPLLVVGSPFILLASKIGGEGIKWSIADLCEQILEEKNEKARRPYRAIPEAQRISGAGETAERAMPGTWGAESAVEFVRAEAFAREYTGEALDIEVKAF